PLEVRLTLPDGTRVLGVHAAPGLDDGPGITPVLSDDELRVLLAPAEADLVIVGHTHVPLDRTIEQVRVFNLGSVSNPMRSRLEASYALLEADAAGYYVQLRYVEYDRQSLKNCSASSRIECCPRLSFRCFPTFKSATLFIKTE